MGNEYFHHYNHDQRRSRDQGHGRSQKDTRNSYFWEDYNPYDADTFNDFDNWERRSSRKQSRNFYDYMDFRQNYQGFNKRTTTSKTKNNSTGRKTNRTTHENDPYDFASDARNYQFTNEDPFYDHQEFHDVYDQYEDPFSIFEQYNLDPNYVAEDFYQNYSHLFNSY